MSMKLVPNTEFKRHLDQGWMLPAQAARRWGVTPRTIFIWIKQEKLICIQSADGYYAIDPKQSQPRG
jgi:hypothetical protein